MPENETAPKTGENQPIPKDLSDAAAHSGEGAVPMSESSGRADESPLTTSAKEADAGKGEKSGTKRFLSRWETVLASLLAVSLLLWLSFRLFPDFAALYNGSVGHFFRRTLAALTNFLPFSLAEVLLCLLPVLLVLVGIYAARRRCGSWRETGRFLLSLCLLVSVFFSLFVFSFAAGYATPALQERLSLPDTEMSAENLTRTALWLMERIEQGLPDVSFDEEGASCMPFDLEEMNEKLLLGFAKVSENDPFIRHFNSRVKPVAASRLLSYTHITGVYSYYTGEANINVYFPDMTLPYTAAHELSHQRGIAREDEANFVAFLVCAASEDAFIRYSGYLSMFDYVADALYTADPQAFAEVIGQLPDEVRGDIRAYNAFFGTFENAGVAVISDKINSAYIKANGDAAGTQSYGLCARLAVAYVAALPQQGD